MGRHTYIRQLDINDCGYDEDKNWKVVRPSKKFIKKIEKKYGTSFEWRFQESEENNGVYYGSEENYFSRLSPQQKEVVYLMTEIDTVVLMLLEVAKKYKRRFCGNILYTDDQSGGSSSGMVYIFTNGSAMIYEFNTDGVDEESKTVPEIRRLSLK